MIDVKDKITISVEEAVELTGIGENKIRELLNDPLCPFVLFVGKRKRVIKRRKFIEYLENADEI